MNQWKEYQQQNKDRFLNELIDLLRIPSVSARSEHKDDMLACAEAMKQKLIDAGADKAEVYKTSGHPIVYGEKIIDEKPIDGRIFKNAVFDGQRYYNLTQTFRASADDAWYGLGQHQDGIINYRGQQVTFFQNRY